MGANIDCGKRRYKSEKEVLKVRASIYKQRTTKLRIYECPDCGGWHLTSEVYYESYTPKQYKAKYRNSLSLDEELAEFSN